MHARLAVAVVAASLLAAGTLPAKSAAAQAETYQVDGAHSFVLYRIKHMGIGYSYGRFDEVSGTVTLDDDPAKSSVVVKVNPASVDSGNEKRDAHLKNPDFFNCAQFPDMKFESTAIKKSDATHYEVTGNLTMHGATKPITIVMEKGGPVADFGGGQRIGFDG